MFGADKLADKLDAVLAALEHLSGQIDRLIRLQQMQVEQAIEFEPDEEAFGLDEAMTA